MPLSTLFRRSTRPTRTPASSALIRGSRPRRDIELPPAHRPADDDESAETLTWLVSSLDLQQGLEMTELPYWPADWPGALPPNAPRHAGPLAAR